MAFPLTSPPAHYTTCSFSTRRCGIFTVGDIVTITLSQLTATSYEVRDFWGTVVSSGLVTSTTLIPAIPVGGWRPGWYRVHLLGAITNDPDYGRSYGATMFTVVRSDARFPALPSAAVATGDSSALLDLPTKAVMGLGASVLRITDAANPTAGGQLAAIVDDIALIDTYWRTPAHGPYADTARPRQVMVSWPNGAVDSLLLPGSLGGDWLRVYVAPGVNGATTYVRSTPGSSSGARVRVYSPNAASLVEDMDNIAGTAAVVAAYVSATSAYVRAFDAGDDASPGTMGSPSAIGASKLTGVATAVTSLAGLVDAYECRTAAPVTSAASAHEQYLFRLAVKAVDFDAQVAGPAADLLPVNVPTGFFAAFGGDWCDVLSVSDTDSMPGSNLPLGQHRIGRYADLLRHYGVDLKQRWHTGHGADPLPDGVFHPRRSRSRVLHALLWEQHGVPRERNQFHEDRNDGTSWAQPTWWQTQDGSCLPDVGLFRTLAEETFGMVFDQPLEFGPLGGAVFLGSVYRGSSSSVVVLVAASHMDDCSVTLNVGAAGTLTISNAFGAQISGTVLDGRITIEVDDVPTYVRLPAADTAVSVYRCNDWPTVEQAEAWRSQSHRAVATVEDEHAPAASDGGWLRDFGSGEGAFVQTGTAPASLVLRFDAAVRVDRLLIWAGAPHGIWSTLLDFDVDVSADNGSTWDTAATVTRTASSIAHGSDGTGVGCTRETWWDEQWIFDVPLDEPRVCDALRVNVRATSYGGEPDAACVAGIGDGDSDQRITIQEAAVLCDAAASRIPQLV